MTRARHQLLVVEDNAAYAEQLKALLSSFGHDCVVARSKTEALAAIEQHEFCLAVLDVKLPENAGDAHPRVEVGQELALALRSRHPEVNPTTGEPLFPLCVLSAEDDPGILAKFYKVKIHAYVFRKAPHRNESSIEDAVADALEKCGRASHEDCLALASERRRPSSWDLDLTARFVSRTRVEIVLAGKVIGLSPKSLEVLLELLYARYCLTDEAWCPWKRLGDNSDPVRKAVSRLRAALWTAFPEEWDPVESDGKERYRLHRDIRVVRIAKEALRSRGGRFKELAEDLPGL